MRFRRVRDDLDREVALPAVPARVVSLVPSVTELVCWLGGADRLVAVTRYCEEPAEVVASLPKVGGTKNPSCDEIVALAPDVVLVDSEENRREDFERLETSGLELFVSDPTSVDGACLSIERIGRLLDMEVRATSLAGEIRSRKREVAEGIGRRKRVFCPIWRNPWMTIGDGTFADDLLRSSGGDNVCAPANRRYPLVDLAEVARASPEVILLPDEPYRFTARHRGLLAPLAHTPACREGHVHLVDGKALFWWGPRTPRALEDLCALLSARCDGSPHGSG